MLGRKNCIYSDLWHYCHYPMDAHFLSHPVTFFLVDCSLIFSGRAEWFDLSYADMARLILATLLAFLAFTKAQDLGDDSAALIISG